MVGTSSPGQLTFSFTLNPFTIVSNFGTYSPTLDSPPSLNLPFDFLITCQTQTFKLYVDGVIVADTLSNFHTTRVGTNLIMPQVTHIALNPSKLTITKVSWTYSMSNCIHNRHQLLKRNIGLFSSTRWSSWNYDWTFCKSRSRSQSYHHKLPIKDENFSAWLFHSYQYLSKFKWHRN